MHILVLAVGRLKDGPERELCERYLQRARKAGPKVGLRGFTVEEVPESRAARPGDRIAGEGEALLARLSPQDLVFCLDSGGDLIDSSGIAGLLAKGSTASAPRAVFIIGGADGLAPQALSRAQRRLSFGRLTWPHQLVRVMLAEQLYRTTTILSGHPYHRA